MNFYLKYLGGDIFLNRFTKALAQGLAVIFGVIIE